jgi:hypothetical protein
VRGRAGRATLVGVAVVVVAAGCAGKRFENGMFHSGSGYRVALPGPAWVVAEGGQAELELRHRAVPAGMLVNAACDGAATGRSFAVLTRHLLIGLRDRTVLASDEVGVNGQRAGRTVVEGRLAGRDQRVRVEAYVLKDGRCVYDLLYVAPPEAFDALRADFEAFVQSFTTE